MPSKLELLLDSIDPRRTLDGVARYVDEAVNSFPFGSIQVESGTELRDEMVRFWRHLQPRMLGLGTNPLPECGPFEWEHCKRTLNAVYSNKTGWRTALDIARSGVEGGLTGVCRRFAERMMTEYVEQLIDAGVQSFWHGLSADERIAAAKEYVATYADVLPAAFVNKHPAELQELLPSILRQHPRMLQRFHRIGRR